MHSSLTLLLPAVRVVPVTPPLVDRPIKHQIRMGRMLEGELKFISISCRPVKGTAVIHCQEICEIPS